ncbi:MAG: MmgE/PrpD family protein [Desulfosarcina sp.]|nr:MmgE/PrpD family protein [Desulfobacterales bacterium]
MNITKNIAEHIVNTDFSDIPEDVLEIGKLCFLDWLGVTMAGARSDVGQVADNYLSYLPNKGQATIIGTQKTSDPPTASLVNGMLSHALDFDDYEMSTILHTTAPSLPAILAAAEQMKSNGKDLLAAIVVAIDITLRIGLGARRIHYDRGWHITSTIGRFGAVAGVARLLGLDGDMVVNALGIAATSAGGLRNVFGSMSKSFHAGKAAADGLTACYLAKKGLDCSSNIFDGKHGFFDVFTENPDREAIMKGLGEQFLLNQVCFKTYPAPL